MRAHPTHTSAVATEHENRTPHHAVQKQDADTPRGAKMAAATPQDTKTERQYTAKTGHRHATGHENRTPARLRVRKQANAMPQGMKTGCPAATQRENRPTPRLRAQKWDAAAPQGTHSQPVSPPPKKPEDAGKQTTNHLTRVKDIFISRVFLHLKFSNSIYISDWGWGPIDPNQGTLCNPSPSPHCLSLIIIAQCSLTEFN